MNVSELTENQRKFCDNFIQSGIAGDAYQKAYPKCKSSSVAQSNGSRLLRNAKVQSYIKAMNKEIASENIAGMKEVKEFWTDTMRNDDNEMKDRLKASEMIAKTNGAFIEKIVGDINTNSKVTHDFSNLTVKQLKELLGKK